MNIHESSEDYLERILMLKEKNGKVRSIDIAIDMNYTKASISRAMKLLREGKYILVDSNGYITLTPNGEAIAKEMIERHKILTSFLVSIGVDEKIAANDACKIEHDLSQDSFNAIKEYIINKKN